MSTDDPLQTPLQYLNGVGPRRAADLQRASLVTVEDLVYRFPIRYEDRARFQKVVALTAGRDASVAGRIQSARLRTTRRRSGLRGAIGDDTDRFARSGQQPFSTSST